MSSAERQPGARDGFTLIELMVAVVLAGILAGVIFELIQGQSRFVALQSARQEAQQNARSSLELIASELRGTSAAGLVTASAHTITFLLPKAWGTVCQSGGDTSMDVVFPSTVTTEMLGVNSASGLVVDAGSQDVREWNPAATLGNARAKVTAAVPISTASGPCFALRGEIATDTVDVVARRLSGANFPLAAPGSLIYLYQVVRYAVVRDGGEWWIYHSNGLTGSTPTMQPLAGPLQSAEALRFRYFHATGAPFIAAPGGNSADLAKVARVQVRVGAQARSGLGVGAVTQTDSITIRLRNH